ncbi:MBL fold metallo-hydrolase [Tumebacillus permanentifrigoris]|uniref:Glyoxylase-like metal-dependent hydrolase (Beta-lactamase superfamily II) n=1 Tax=Tumebacillus permanentifrigoris TaxID=378543 RepID=A0A316D9Z8_9BACL|nr:MBL fold metallo-hydrolase [Tumebacillus permanentifrigoris]PWK13054.1 glyoxylase-like metal-dependent hydrolase (beta-lactamase superfamily II) [Tumebacillus permanentifrigoris]
MNRGYELHTLKVGLNFTRNFSYILVDNASRQAAVVDPAWDLDVILDKIRALGVELTTILLTHSHDDHVNRVDALLQIYPAAQVYMSKQEIVTYGFSCANLFPFGDGEMIWLGETPITCLVTAGHTAGGACFLLEDDLLSGDTVFIEGCGICDTVGGSPVQMYESLQKIRRLVAPHVRVFPGHSYGKEPGAPLRVLLSSNIYFQFEKVEHFVQFRMRKNQRGSLNFK